MRLIACAGVLAWAQASHAIDLTFPVDCNVGETCFIQNYVDADQTPDFKDFMCHRLSYDGHKGTDIALPAARDMDAGVAVLAAAEGTVVGVRDGVPEHLPGQDMDFPEGQDCGNGLVIAHDDGWETQYCHLRTGSVIFSPGDYVMAGQKIGKIGMSGRTEFPHLHMSLRHDGKTVDPFDPAPDAICGASTEDQLWQPPLPYRPGGIIQAGFAPAVPEFDTIKLGDAHSDTLTRDDDAIVLWAHLFGMREGDELHLTIDGPSGMFFEHSVSIKRTQAQSFHAGGRRLRAGIRVPGQYKGVVHHIRDGLRLGEMRASVTLE